MENKRYLIYFMGGSSGRFLSTILYGLLVDPIRIEYPWDSAHEAQILHPGTSQFHPEPTRSVTWHEYPTAWDPTINYIIVRVSADDLEEIARNSFHKNLLWNMTRLENGQLDANEAPAENGQFPPFLRAYRRAMGLDWRKQSVSELTAQEITRMQGALLKWDRNGSEFAHYSNPQVPEGQSHLIIDFQDIFAPSSWDSWRALDQLVEYTQVSSVDAQVRDNYQRYVFQRNSNL